MSFAGIKRVVRDKLLSKGLRIIRNSNFEESLNYYKNLAREYRSLWQSNQFTDSIVFSKDRAMQLHAFLSSYKQKVKSDGKVYVIYRTSNQSHKNSYDELKNTFEKNKEIVFIEEDKFYDDLVNLINKSGAGKIVLYVDDIIFTRQIDYKDFTLFDSLQYTISLGRGSDLDYSIVLDKRQQIPAFTEVAPKWFSFSWNESKEKSDWTFPVGVGAYVYDRIELLLMLEKLAFSTPNSLEIAMQRYYDYFVGRKGVCKDKAVCVAVHANVVQNDIESNSIDTFSIENLLKKWNEGQEIDISKFENLVASQAQIQEYSFTVR